MSRCRLIIEDVDGEVSVLHFGNEDDFADAYVSICEDSADPGIRPIITFSSQWEAHVTYVGPAEADI